MTLTGRPVGTAERMLDAAERLVQSRGFNAFSYADVAAELGVAKASLHYHFPSKAELGKALIDRYIARFARALAAIDTGNEDAPTKLQRYVSLYADVLRDERMCLCGMLAADYETLPPPMREAVVRFFDTNEVWLQHVLEEGEAAGELRYTGPAREEARLIVSALEGAMLVARSYHDPERIQASAGRLILMLDAT